MGCEERRGPACYSRAYFHQTLHVKPVGFNIRMMQTKTVVRVDAEEPVKRLALLIDADNAQASVIEGVLGEVARFGEAAVRRIYGDFTSTNSASWKKVLNQHSIKPVQQFAYSTGKNATDGTMIIDAMDLLYTRRFDGFCLVTSDSDFTGLALRLREEALQVYGFGERKTPEAFRNACHKFIFTEVLRVGALEPGTQPDNNNQLTGTPRPVPSQFTPVPQKFLMEALEKSIDDTGWAHLGTFGSYLQKVQPDFDSRIHGYKKLSDLVRAEKEIFETQDRIPPGGTSAVLYLRSKKLGLLSTG